MGEHKVLTTQPNLSGFGVRSDIIRSFFGKPGGIEDQQQPDNEHELGQNEEFFTFYNKVIKRINDVSVKDLAQREQVKSSLADSATICTMIKLLRRLSTSSSKHQICECLKPYLSPELTDHDVEQILDILLSCLLRINIRTRGGWSRGSQYTEWSRDESVDELLAKSLPSCRPVTSSIARRIERKFTVAYMTNVRGLKLQATDHLGDHLVVCTSKGGQRTLLVFHHKDWLNRHKDAAELVRKFNPEGGIQVPTKVIDETIMSLNLLFPRADADTEKLCEKEGWLSYVDPPYRGARDFAEFDVWRERLVEIYEDIFDAPPYDLRSLWRERRDLERWSAIWFALMLGLISTVATVIQTTYTVLGYYERA